MNSAKYSLYFVFLTDQIVGGKCVLVLLMTQSLSNGGSV